MSNFLNHPMVKLNQGYALNKKMLIELSSNYGLEQSDLRRFHVTQGVSSIDQARVLESICNNASACSNSCPVFIANQCNKDTCEFKGDGSKMRDFINKQSVVEMNNLI